MKKLALLALIFVAILAYEPMNTTNASFSTSVDSAGGGTFEAGCWKIPPKVPLIAPADETITKDFLIAFSWREVSSSCPKAVISYNFEIYSDPNLNLLNQATGFQPNMTSYYYRRIGEGVYYWRVLARDQYGKVSSSAVRSLTIRRTGGAGPMFWVEEDAKSALIEWKDTTPNVSYRIYRDENLIATVGGTTYTDEISGDHMYEVRSVDALNLESQPQKAKKSYTIDYAIDDGSRAPDFGNTGTAVPTIGPWYNQTTDFTDGVEKTAQYAVGGDFFVSGTGMGQEFAWTNNTTIKGSFDVAVQYLCDDTRTVARYDVYSGSQKLNSAPIELHQDHADGGTSSDTACGKPGGTLSEEWVSLGTFAFFGASPKVVLTVNPGEQNIVADAVGFRKVSDAPPVVLNEIQFRQASESATMPDGQWVELYNNGYTPVNVDGWKLVSKAGNILPINSADSDTNQNLSDSGETVISPHSFLVTYVNGQAVFDTNGDTVSLFSGDNVQLDQHAYTSFTLTGATDSLIADGIGSWTNGIPTPAKPNQLFLEILSPSASPFASEAPSPSASDSASPDPGAPSPSPDPSNIPTPSPSPSGYFVDFDVNASSSASSAASLEPSALPSVAPTSTPVPTSSPLPEVSPSPSPNPSPSPEDSPSPPQSEASPSPST
jgi:hypothetical protein